MILRYYIYMDDIKKYIWMILKNLYGRYQEFYRNDINDIFIWMILKYL